MCASWNNEYRHDLLASAFEKIKLHDKTTGRVSMRGFESQEYFSVLCSMVKLSEDITEIERHGIITNGVFKAAKKGIITSKSLLNEISALERSYLQKIESPFVLATTVSILNNAKVPTFKIGPATITFSRQLPPRFTKAREKAESGATHQYIKANPSNFLTVRVHVKSRTAHDAVNEALNEFDLLRGIWNLGLNKGGIRISYGKKMAVNKIVLGPLHTLHDPVGKLKTDIFRYEPQFDELFTPYDWAKTNNEMNNFVKKVRRKLKRCQYNGVVADSIIRYVRALDYSDLNVAFLKLWGVLELLTNTLRDGYDKTIRRAAFLCSERDYHFQVLNHLRDNRNKSVHTGNESPDTETLVYQLKRYVERLIDFHLSMGQNFTTIGESTEFLDLPADKVLLGKRLALYKQAVKFIS
ncbi:MAG: hypothetical protein JW943_15305 [Deltaproteobacteria bacterium]|nr:hypothetical protein [Deltaproteobacteria bacterium]